MNNNLLNVINLLNDGYYLKGTYKNNELIFYKENDIIKVSSINYNLSIKVDDFINIYKDYEFSLIKEKEEFKEDKEKDLEYYSKLQKRG